MAAMTISAENRFEKTALVAENLACVRGGRWVFAGLSFTLESGGLLYLRGRNGSGKSTLLRLIAGFVPAKSGTLSFGTSNWLAAGPAADEAVIYAGHDNALKPVLTLRENAVAYARLMTGAAPCADALEAAAHVFGLGRLLDQPARLFSSGQKHRANLMRFALIRRPVWLMDEPTVGLDATNRSALAALMQTHLDAGGMILAATHDPIGVEGHVLTLEDFEPEVQPVADLDEAWA